MDQEREFPETKLCPCNEVFNSFESPGRLMCNCFFSAGVDYFPILPARIETSKQPDSSVNIQIKEPPLQEDDTKPIEPLIDISNIFNDQTTDTVEKFLNGLDKISETPILLQTGYEAADTHSRKKWNDFKS